MNADEHRLDLSGESSNHSGLIAAIFIGANRRLHQLIGDYLRSSAVCLISYKVH
jgi:hypothetical protein